MSKTTLPAGDAANWLDSAQKNFERVRERHARQDPCVLIEHYTDVVAEATAASVIARDIETDLPGIHRIEQAADKLVRTATRAQRGATKACSLGIRRRS